MTAPGLRYFAAALLSCAVLGAGSSLSDDDRKMLQDPGGWEYISLSSNQAGVPTQHTCFDGAPHPDECSGRLVFTADGKFRQLTRITGQAYNRQGRYELNDDQLAFIDELENRDGPYTLKLDRNAKTLKLTMPQVTIDLMLEKEYKARQKSGRAQ